MSTFSNRRRIGATALLGGAALAAGLGVAAPAQAGNVDTPTARTIEAAEAAPLSAEAAKARPNFKMPFPCGQVWRGQTRFPSTHNPAHSIDWNQGGGDDDKGKRVVASKGGKVLSSYKSSSGYGNTIVIGHGNGWQTRYAHLYSRAVSKGDKVGQGRFIGRVGKTGGQATTHLHYEQIHNGTVVTAVVQGKRFPDSDRLVYMKSRNCR